MEVKQVLDILDGNIGKPRLTLRTPVSDLCSFTKEPILGSFIEIKYTPENKFLGLRSILSFIETCKLEPMDLETFTYKLFIELKSIFTDVQLSAHYILSTGIVLDLEYLYE